MNDIPTTTRQIVLASRPQGEPTAENFRLEDAALPDLQDGQVLVRTSLMSVLANVEGLSSVHSSATPPPPPAAGYEFGDANLNVYWSPTSTDITMVATLQVRV